MKGFTESLRQDSGYVRVGVVEPGGVATELGSHNRPEIRTEMIDHVADPRTRFRMITTPGQSHRSRCGLAGPFALRRFRDRSVDLARLPGGEHRPP